MTTSRSIFQGAAGVEVEMRPVGLVERERGSCLVIREENRGCRRHADHLVEVAVGGGPRDATI
jgi:hypothetical protein